jgi:hypothetical protein
MREIWGTLSQVDCTDKIEKKNGLSYLSWAWAWGVLMEYYPEATFAFGEPKSQPDGTMMVFCTVTIGENSRTMWLPVMDYKNKAVVNPDVFALNSAMMRCLVKCLALYGLGHYIYAGEDLPTAAVQEPKLVLVQEPRLPAQIEESVKRAIHSCTDIDELRTVWRTLTKEQRDAHADIIEEVQERLA